MDDDDQAAVESMLHYLYTLDYPSKLSPKSEILEDGGRAFWTSDLDIFIIADKYSLPDLADMAHTELYEKVDSTVRASDDEFRQGLEGFVQLLELLYCDDASEDLVEIRKDVVDTLARLLGRHVRNACLEDFLVETPGFSCDLIESLCRSTVVGNGTSGVAKATTQTRIYVPLNEESDTD